MFPANTLTGFFRNTSFRSALLFVGSGLVFTLTYAQSPLYTSNQNQYFLHGLARAGYGYLGEDWLANTRDPTPIFSLLVDLTYRIFNSEILLYVYYGILLSIYLYALWGIACQLNLGWTVMHSTMFAVTFLVVHSAAFRYLLTLVIGADWSYILEGGLANQRVLGAVFQPSCFGVFLILAIYLYLKGKEDLAAIAVAGAATVHPTYLLGGAIIIGSFTLVSFIEGRDILKSLRTGMVALVFVVPILVYVFLSFRSALPQETAIANDILMDYRLPHHAVISEWFDLSSVIQIGILLIAILLARRTRLFWILAVSTLIAAGLTIIQWITTNATLALLFPWRVSVILIPLSMTMILARISSFISNLSSSKASHLPSIRKAGVEPLGRPAEASIQRIRVEPLGGMAEALAHAPTRAVKTMKYLSGISIAFLILAGVARFVIETGQQPQPIDRDLYRYISSTNGAQEVYLIPTKMQDFRLATGAPAFVDFKSIPYAAGEVIEWYRRISITEDIYRAGLKPCKMLNQLRESEFITHVVAEKPTKYPGCPKWEVVYEDEVYMLIMYIRSN